MQNLEFCLLTSIDRFDLPAPCSSAAPPTLHVASEPTLPPYDPYVPKVTFLTSHAKEIAAATCLVLTVLLTVASFPPVNIAEAAYVMLTPGIYWAYTKPSLKLYVWTMGIAQAIAWIILLAWLRHVTWLGLLLLGPFVGLWVGTWYLAAWWTMPRMLGRATFTRLVAMAGLAGAWVLIEWTRTWLLSGFPWLPLAASQWQRVSILQIAAYTGGYGVSFVLVAVNIGFAAYAHRLLRESATGFNKRSQEFFLAIFLLLLCLCVHFQEAFNHGRYSVPLGRIAFVQPDIPQEAKWDEASAPGIVQVLRKTTLDAAATNPDLILWPEASTPWAVRGDDSMKAFVESLARQARAPMLIGSLAVENPGKPNEHWFNAAFSVSPRFGVRQNYYAKRHLVPFGEYVPLHALLGWIKKFVPIGPDATAGVDSAPLLVRVAGEPIVFGPLICYEDVFPSLARSSVVVGANVLVVLTNDGWYGEGGAACQDAAHSVLRAVEFRRPVLRCGNAGWSGWIDEFGTIRAELTRGPDGNIHTSPSDAAGGTIYFRGAAAVNVTHDSRWTTALTFYARHGDWFVLACAGLVLLAFSALKFAPPPISVLRATNSDAEGSG